MNQDRPGDFLPLAAPKMWTRGFLLLFGIITLIQVAVIRETAAVAPDDADFRVGESSLDGFDAAVVEAAASDLSVRRSP